MAITGNRVGDLFGRLGLPASVLDSGLQKVSDAPLAALKTLSTTFQSTAVEANKFGAEVLDARVEIPPFAHNPPPQEVLRSLQPFVGRTYHRPAEARHASSGSMIQNLFNPRLRRAVEMTRLLQTNTPVRQAFERSAGAQVVRDGRMDGTVSLREPSSSRAPSGASDVRGTMTIASALNSNSSSSSNGASSATPKTIYEFLMQMDAVVLAEANRVANTLPNGTGGSGSLSGSGKGNALGGYAGGILGGSSGLTGTSDSSAYRSEEDEEEGESYNTGFAQSSTGSPSPVIGGPVGYQGTGTDWSNTGIDAAAFRLKEIMAKRDQMYDVVRQTFDKFSQSAKQAIDNTKA